MTRGGRQTRHTDDDPQRDGGAGSSLHQELSATRQLEPVFGGKPPIRIWPARFAMNSGIACSRHGYSPDAGIYRACSQTAGHRGRAVLCCYPLLSRFQNQTMTIVDL